jgi:6-phospho-beta-glucosidase
MKLAIIGGGGVRVPLLINGLVGRGLPVAHIALFDPDRARLNVMARLAAARMSGVTITSHDKVRDCVESADFVVTSIRVGGLEARCRDESIALAHGLVGQETVGPGGFAMAIRTIPVLAAYAEAIARHAPDAWVINFTNPVGIVTQAMQRAADLRIVGICDTPTELFTEVAHALGLPARECAVDYIGLNHLGWVREVYHAGRPHLERVWTDRPVLERLYSRRLFPPEYLESLRLLPTEYVYYYEFPQQAVDSMRSAGTSRGAIVSRLTDRLFADLEGAPDPVATYEQYLADRSASYLQIESGQSAPSPPSPWAELTGYDRIAFDVMHAIVHDTNAIVPLNVANDGNVPELAPDDVIEVPCAIGAQGPLPLLVGSFPPQVRKLAVRVKEYERKTVDAAKSLEREPLVDALAHNPLVPSRDLAAKLVDELTLSPSW